MLVSITKPIECVYMLFQSRAGTFAVVVAVQSTGEQGTIPYVYTGNGRFHIRTELHAFEISTYTY